MNGKDLGEYKLQVETQSLDTNEDKFIPSFWQMLKTPVILVNMIITMIQWSAIASGYYLIAYYIKYIEGNIFFLSITSNIAVLIGYLVGGFLQKWLGT